MSQTDLKIALTRLVELAEYEIGCPACPDPPEAWVHDLKWSTQITRRFLSEIRPDPGEFFTSPANEGRGRPSNQVTTR